MTKSLGKFWLIAGGVAALQTALLGWIVWDRVDLLANGREITMKVIPVDPRDLFRGDYVILGYELSPLKHDTKTDGPLPNRLYKGRAIYVTIARDAENAWKPVGFGMAYPETVAPEQAVLKGRIENVHGGRASGKYRIRVRYGIESYFVPEGTGVPIEKLVREKKVEALVAVGSDGEVALKALLSDGERISEQPLL